MDMKAELAKRLEAARRQQQHHQAQAHAYEGAAAAFQECLDLLTRPEEPAEPETASQ